MDYLSRIRNRGAGKETGVPAYLHDKIKGREFVEAIGGPVPELLAVYERLDEINLENLPDWFVLKPTFSSSSYGVMVLERTGSNYYDHLRRRELQTSEIIEEQAELVAKTPNAHHRWIVEERIVDEYDNPVPDDYKFFTFQGEIGLVHRTIRVAGRNKHGYFDGGFNPLEDPDNKLIEVNEKIIVREVMDTPDNSEQLLNLAKRISIAVPSPFVRIDMYNTKTGPIFGEFTLVPGTFYYEDREVMKPPLSYRLGYLWDLAEKTLKTSR